ncbi:sensor protein KdpD [Parapedobacter sp. GCM10030251]|uniref:sensor protein KdpD n=1 Tax=Parapedobacter sp. GCM10030251 TaxID=3273419 RepID=UPI00361D1E63
MEEDRKSADHFLDLIKKSRLGKFKIYIGMSAGVGKTYRMLQEAHTLLRNGIDVKIGYIETHGRAETSTLVEGLPVVPRRNIFYKGRQLTELDVQAVINLHPEVVVVDELAHTNIEGSKNEKRWQDVIEILEAGITVISAVNIQHIESLNEEVKAITGVDVRERIPDKVIAMADEIVNIDLTAEDLITRLKEGKIYQQDKIQTALDNFFKSEHILQLRELALKEVAGHVVRKVDHEVHRNEAFRHERFLACIGSDAEKAKHIIRKTARIASYYSGDWYVLYVQTPRERLDRIALDKQRMLINNFKMATQWGGEVIQVQRNSIPAAIIEQAIKMNITTVCIGKPRVTLLRVILSTGVFNRLLNKLAETDIDLIMLS